MKLLKLTATGNERQLFIVLDQLACIADDHNLSEITLINGEKLSVLENNKVILLKIAELLETDGLLMC